ncbi:MAG: hypothetical protein RIT81_40775 [Deltaproteobacteria bacterium]
MKSRARSLAINIALLMFTFGALEIGLQIAQRVSDRAARALAHPEHRDNPYVLDKDRGFRGNPRRFDHDGRGYRNADDIEKTHILAIGDSQTYGVGVDRVRAWPYAIHEDLDIDVYNMGLGGYSPAHHLFDMDRMLGLHPKVVVYGVYFGNDLMESFAIARDHPELRAHVDDDVWTAAMLRDEATPIESAIDLFVRRGAPAALEVPKEPSLFARARNWVSDHFMLYAVARSAYHLTEPRNTHSLLTRDFDKTKAAITPREAQYCSAYEDASWRTFLTAPYRGYMIDREDPRVEAGFFVMVHALERIIAMADGAGAAVIVVLIPTKERVFASRIEDLAAHPKLPELVANEEHYKSRLVAALKTRRVTIVDVLPALVESGRQPYFEDADGHPNDYGHGRIAEAVAGALPAPSAQVPRFAAK